MTRFSDQNKKIGQARTCSSDPKLGTMVYVAISNSFQLLMSWYNGMFCAWRTLAHIQPNSKDEVHCKPSHFGYVSWQGRGDWPSLHILVYAIFLFENGTRWKFRVRKISWRFSLKIVIPCSCCPKADHTDTRINKEHNIKWMCSFCNMMTHMQATYF